MATTTLGDKNIGNVIKITVGNAARNFVILHKGNPSSAYQGFNNTVIVMQQNVDPRTYNVINTNGSDYANSALAAHVNGVYYNSIAAEIRNQIAQVRIPYRAGSGNSTSVSGGASGLLCKVFLLSIVETGYATYSNLNIVTEGVKLDYFIAGDEAAARTQRIANRDGAPVSWWLRSPILNGFEALWCIDQLGTPGIFTHMSDTSYGPRPAFALPSSLLVSDDGSVFTNTPPAINYSGANDLGAQTAGFAVDYNVTDADNDPVTVTERLNGAIQHTFSPALGEVQTFQEVFGDNFQKVLNGAHTLTLEATDGKAPATPVNIAFTKAVYSASVTLQTPLTADDMPTAIRLIISGSLPPDAVLSVMVCNNGNDASPTWEDMTYSVVNGFNFLFTNTTKTDADWGINFKVSISRGPSNTGGYIYGIEGAFQ